MITIQVSVSKGWLHNEGGFTFPDRYYFDPLYRWEQDRAADDFVKNRFPALPVYNMESNLVQAEYFDPDQVLIGGIQPNLLLGMAVGAQLRCYENKDPDIDGKPLEGAGSVHDLPDPASLPESKIMRLLDSQVETIRRERPDSRPIPPFFWDSSGRATIHGMITTAQKLFGENAFILMKTDPEEFAGILAWITEVYSILIEHFASCAGLRVSSIHVGECSGAMISGSDFLEHIVPYIDRLGERFHSVRLHSCGNSDHLIEAISRIRGLTIIDTGSETSIARIRSLAGVDFEIHIAPPLNYLADSAAGDEVNSWVDRTVEENARGPLKIQFHIEPGYSMERCLQIFERLAGKGITIGRV